MTVTSPAPLAQARHSRASPHGLESAALHKKLLRLVCGLCVLMGVFYLGYFLLAGMGGRSWLAAGFILAGVGARAYAQSTQRHGAALDTLTATMFVAIASIALFQDGLDSPALRWLVAPLCIALLSGSLALAATLLFLFLVETALLAWHGPGSWGSVSLLAPMPYRQMGTAVFLSTLSVALIVGSSARWTISLQRALRSAHRAAIKAVAAQARFVSHLSHELRTPLQGLVGATDILKANHLPGGQRDHLVGIQSQSVKSVLELLNAVLDFSKLEASKMKLSEGPLDLRSLVLQINEHFAISAFSKGLELTSSCAADVPAEMRGDATRIRQVVGNLVSNAVKFTASGGVHIHVAAEARSRGGDPSLRTISIEVQDTGLGMDAACLASLFKPFHQADETVAPRFGGTGLGLAISKSLAELMGGRISVLSAPGAGATFTLLLPLADTVRAPMPNAVEARGTVVVATSSVGLSRHLGTRLGELGFRATRTEQVPTEADARHLGAALVLVDAPLLHDRSVEAGRRLEGLAGAGIRVAVVAPLTADPEPLAEGVPVLYKPVSTAALTTLTAEEPPAGPASPHAPAFAAGVAADVRPTVLVAEDDIVNQVVVRSMLVACGLDVVTASDGNEALEILQRRRVAIVLTDVRMPGLDGLAATRALRRWERSTGTTRTPVVAMTGHYEAEETSACLEAGMDDVLVKPFRLEDLRRKLAAHLPLPGADGEFSSTRSG